MLDLGEKRSAQWRYGHAEHAEQEVLHDAKGEDEGCGERCETDQRATPARDGVELTKGTPAGDEPAETHEEYGKVQQVVGERKPGRGGLECPHPHRVGEEVVRVEPCRHAEHRVVGAENSECGGLQDHEHEVERADNIKVGRECRGKACAPARHPEQEVDDRCEQHEHENFEHGHARYERSEIGLLSELRELQQEANRDGDGDKDERPRKVACCVSDPAQDCRLRPCDKTGEIREIARQLLEHTFQQILHASFLPRVDTDERQTLELGSGPGINKFPAESTWWLSIFRP